MKTSSGTRRCKRLANLFLRTSWGKVGETLWKKNQSEYQMGLTKIQKGLVTVYLVAQAILEDRFPHKGSESEEDAYRKECEYLDQLGGTTRAEMDVQGLTKPFWFDGKMIRFLEDFCRITRILKRNQVRPSASILELGCGAGWLSELLARCGYNVLGTTLDPKTVQVAQRRASALQCLGIGTALRFKEAAMEHLEDNLHGEDKFDAAVIYEALHHVYDWRAALKQVGNMLRPGGLLVIANEPNLIHTLRSYRVACLTHTHEIGMSTADIIQHMKTLGFLPVRYSRFFGGFGVCPIWIVAKKGVRSMSEEKESQ